MVDVHWYFRDVCCLRHQGQTTQYSISPSWEPQTSPSWTLDTRSTSWLPFHQMYCSTFDIIYMTQNPTSYLHFVFTFSKIVTCVSWGWYIDGRRCSIATTTPGWTIMGSGAGGVKFRELTAARLPPPGESSNLWLYIQFQRIYCRKYYNKKYQEKDGRIDRKRGH